MVRFLYTRGRPGVIAWNLPAAPDPRTLDIDRYTELLLRAAATILQPLGVEQDLLRRWLLGGDGYTGREQNTLFPLESVSSVSLYRTAVV